MEGRGGGPGRNIASTARFAVRTLILRLIGSLLAANLGGCGLWSEASTAAPNASRDQAQQELVRPPIERNVDFETVTAEIDVPLGLSTLTAWFNSTGAAAFNSFLTGTNAVPGVASTEAVSGSWNKLGDRRRVVFSDNNSAIEEITDLRPGVIEYQIWKLTSRTGRYITYAVSHVSLQGDDMVTHVRWTYSFRPLVPIDGWLIRAYVQNDFRKFMEVGLAAMQARVLADTAKRPRDRSAPRAGRA